MLEQKELPPYSVLMSVYYNDNADYLELAINSMLKQTVFPNQYVIVKDGGVTEEIQVVLDNFLKKYPTLFTMVELKENKGLGNALNEGLKYCRNELVARMDADDISLPNRCEQELQLFAKNEKLAICGCNIDEFYKEPDNIRTSRIVPQTFEEIKKFMRKRQPFNHPTVVYRKSKVLEVGGYKTLKRKEDFDLFSRMLMNGCYAVNINESLYLYRANEDNYARRKSWTNFKGAIYVYWLHLKRKGCSILDFIIVCGAELLFFLLPQKVMKRVSDKFLRKNKKNEIWKRG